MATVRGSRVPNLKQNSFPEVGGRITHIRQEDDGAFRDHVTTCGRDRGRWEKGRGGEGSGVWRVSRSQLELDEAPFLLLFPVCSVGRG